MAAAFAATWLLALQSVLGGLAFGAAPNAARIDAFGNVICSHEGAAELPSGDPRQPQLPACCALGCIIAWAAYGPPPEGGLALGVIPFETAAITSDSSVSAGPGRERSPSSPRAPPTV